MTEYELLRRARTRIEGLEREVERLERELKLERQRSQEWKLRASVPPRDACLHPPHACVAVGKLNGFPRQSMRCEDCGAEWNPGDPPWPNWSAPRDADGEGEA